jgi:hypothetical protein
MDSEEERERTPPDQEVQVEESNPAPGDARSDQANAEPKIQTETPGSRTRRVKLDRQALVNAGISALAALMGALIGGLSSYFVAQDNNAAQADEAQIARKQAAYADYITHHTDLMITEADVSVHYRSNSADTDEVNALNKRLDDNYSKWLHTDFIVRVVDTPGVDSLRAAIYDQIQTISSALGDLGDIIRDGKAPDQALDKLDEHYRKMAKLEDAFTKAAKDDLRPSKPKLFFLF